MESRRAGPGCAIALATLIVGVLIGAAGMAAFLGLGLNEIVARANGRAAPVLVEVTPTVAVQIVGGAAPGRRLVWRAPIALDTDTSEPDLLVISRNYDRDSDTVLLYSPDAGQVRWESPPLGKNATGWTVAFSAQTIIVADEARLIGLSRADGGKLWEAPLSDRIFYNVCRECLQTFGDVVVALADDGVLQAFDAGRGAPLWSVRLREATRQMVRVGDMVGVPDSLAKGESEAGLFLYSPRDGSLQRTIAPVCSQEAGSYEDRPHYYDRIVADPRVGALYWMLDSAYCLLKVDADGAEQRIIDRGFHSFDDNNVLAADGALYLSLGKQMMLVDPQGAARLLLDEVDYSLQPLEARGDALLVLASRTRGSSRLELWLVDRQSGARRWARPLTADNLLGGPYDSGDFAAHLLGDAVALIEQRDEPEQIQIDLLSLENGTSAASLPIQVDDPGDSIRGVAWGNRMAWAAIGKLYGVGLDDGATRLRWP